MSNLVLELSSLPNIIELVCPECFEKFSTTKAIYRAAVSHDQKNVFCSAKCAKINNQVSREQLAERIRDFYKTHNRVPVFKDFKLSSVYRKKFGNWTNALRFAGFDTEADNRLRLNKTTRTKSNAWQKQRSKYIERKKMFVEEKGGCCKVCGYNKNLAVLTFHHTDPSIKTMSLDARSMLNVPIEQLRKEIEHCDLLCANCHLEIHYPGHDLK